MVVLRILFDDDVICEDVLSDYSIDGEVLGYKLKCKRFYYSRLPIHSIKKFNLLVDGEKLDSGTVNFCLGNKYFKISQLPELYTEYWYFIDNGELIINIPGGLSEGDHKIDLKFEIKKSNTFMLYHKSGLICIPG